MTEKQIKDQSIHELNLIRRDYGNISSDVGSSPLVKEVEKRFNKLFSKSNAVKILVEPEQGYIVDANGKACEFYGYTLHDIRRKKITEINKLTEQEVIEEYKKQKLEERDYFINKQQIQSGAIVPVEVRSAKVNREGKNLFYFLIHKYNGEIKAVSEIEVDLEKHSRHKESEITPEAAPLMFAKDLELIENNARELVTLTQKLTESERTLRELNASKDRFFSIISHDIKNNFASILGLSRLLTQPEYDQKHENRRETAALLNLSSQKLYTLLENLLEWAKLQQDEIVFGPQRFGIKEAGREILDLFQLRADEKKITLENNLPDETGVFADQNMIKTVLRNLISNAINFTDVGGKVSLASYEENGNVIIVVEDNGIGIEEVNLNKLFRIDEKYVGLNTEGQKGTGLGLILCREFVEKNNGEIWVESKIGAGSKFFVSLPK
ncbi:MAG: PAS domain-containing sensor histidine kinase [Melioribacteraceae bacterium]|nr:PAS domain-containing sensor histidine kinase [Melioribacteraceae bacterium]